MFCSTMFVQTYAAVDFVVGGISYEITDAATKEVQVVAGDIPYSGKVVIPETITYSGQIYSVNGCSSNAFKNSPEVTALELNCSGYFAASGPFPNLTLINVGKSLTRLSTRFDAPKLEEVVVDRSSSNFSDVDGILFDKEQTNMFLFPASHRFEEYTLPSTVVRFRFRGCNKLKKLSINSGELAYSSHFENCTALEEVNFGDNAIVNSINNDDFKGCENLKRLTCNNTLKEINIAAFKDCPNLEWLHLKSEVPPSIPTNGSDYYAETVIPRNCFLYVPENSVSDYSRAEKWKGVLNIISDGNGIELPSRIHFQYGLFDYSTIPWLPGCVQLNSRDIHESVGSYVYSAYDPEIDEGYAHVVIPSEVKFRGEKYSVYSMSGHCFHLCYDIQSLFIPASVKELNCNTFEPWWKTGKSVTIDSENPYWHISEHDGFKGIWSKDGCRMILCMEFPKDETLVLPEVLTAIEASIPAGNYTELIIPDEVKLIDAPIASGHEKLKKLIIGSGVEAIQASVCYDCPAITAIECRAVVPPNITYGFCFNLVNKSSCVLTVPLESVEAYKAADFWKDFIIVGSESAIEQVSADTTYCNSAVYNMQGVKVNAERLPAGLYISNGRKFSVR